MSRHQTLLGGYLPALGNEAMEYWTPVAELCKGKIRVGLSRSGQWVMPVHDDLVLLTQDGLLRELLPCLEDGLEETKSSLLRGLTEKNLPVDLVDNFPFGGIIYTALMFKSDYWIEFAYAWLGNIPMTNTIADALTQVISSKRVSQKNRHRAQKLLAKWKRKQAGG